MCACVGALWLICGVSVAREVGTGEGVVAFSMPGQGQPHPQEGHEFTQLMVFLLPWTQGGLPGKSGVLEVIPFL